MTRRPLLALGIFGLVFVVACGGNDSNPADTAADETATGSTTESATETGVETSGTETGTETGETETTGEQSCYAELHAIVSDIDETLTTADAEFLMQLVDSSYDPLERLEAAELMNDYHDRGYTVVYMTARAESQSSLDMIPARDLTEDWLVAHGFPYDDDTRLVLADSFVTGDATTAYKAGALMELQAEGFSFDYAYGNAVTDIAAYDMAGIAKDVTFIIGEQAGVDGTVAISGEDWVMHRADQIPMVADYCGG